MESPKHSYKHLVRLRGLTASRGVLLDQGKHCVHGMGGACLLRWVSGREKHWLEPWLTDLDLHVYYPTAGLDTDRQPEVWMIVCVCDWRAGEGGVQISSNAIKFGAVHSCLTHDWPSIYQNSSPKFMYRPAGKWYHCIQIKRGNQ